ncbi:hypothetical protein DL768_007190 [Monosporascus sp. mg162]|nr:hypothetical protein DL768_007190 [Monosporascus sp. mg162]
MASTVPIYSRVNESGTVFISLERALRNSSRFAAQVPPEDIRDEFDRFKMWAGNIAAHRKGRRSLEYRLRDAALLKDEAHNLLTALHDSLQTCLAIIQEKRRPWDELSDSESDSDSDTELSDDAEAQGDTELKQLLGSIKTTITCLFRLSMSIRDPAPNDQSRSIITVDKSYFEEYDMQHVKAKYPGCAGYLVERLGRANSGRRQYLSYREEHHQKLAKDVDLIGLEASRSEHTNNSTEATPMPKARLNSFDVHDSDDALSQTSYATSVNAAIRVPPLPKEARCTTADRLYDSRRAWFTHELEAHRISWQCIEGCEKTFSLEKYFDRHVQTSHPDLSQPGMLSALKRTAAKRSSLTDKAHCPLCDQRMTIRSLQRHVARHQEQLALFTLPPNLETTEDDPQDVEKEVYVRLWQDEDLSDVSDTLDTDESAGEGQVPVGGSSPEAPQNPVHKLEAIALEFYNLAPQCESFISRPPLGQVECDFLHKKLSQILLQEVLLKVDEVETFGDSYARLRRKELITEVQLLLNRMDNVLPTEPKGDDSVEQAGEESLQNAEEVAGATGVEPSPMSKELYDAHRPPRSDADAESNSVTLSSLHSTTADLHNDKDTRPQPKGILRKPTEEFPGDPNPDRDGVAPLGRNEDNPPGVHVNNMMTPASVMQDLELLRFQGVEEGMESEPSRKRRMSGMRRLVDKNQGSNNAQEESEHPRRAPALVKEYDEVDRDERVPRFLREENRRTDAEQLVLRSREVETVDRQRPHSPSPQPVTRYVERLRNPSPPWRSKYRRRPIYIERSRSPPPQRERDFRIDIDSRVSERRRPGSPTPDRDRERDRIRIMTERERFPSSSSSPSPPPPAAAPSVIKGPTIEREVITHYRDIERRKSRSPTPNNERDRIRIMTERERIRSLSTSPSPPPPPAAPSIIKGPTIEREVIMHYRDVDHGVERARPPGH